MIRAINLLYPFGSFIVNEISNGIITSMPFDLSCELICIIENKEIIGSCSFLESKKLSRDDAYDLFHSHKMSKDDIDFIWPNSKTLYFHKRKISFVVNRVKTDIDSGFLHKIDFNNENIVAVND